MNWTWFPEYLPLLIQGLWLTIQLLVLSMVFGLILAVPVGLVQVTGPRWLARNCPRLLHTDARHTASGTALVASILAWVRFCCLSRGPPKHVLAHPAGRLFLRHPGIYAE